MNTAGTALSYVYIYIYIYTYVYVYIEMLGERRLNANITEEWLIKGDRMFSDQSVEAEIWRSLPLLTL